MTTAHEQPTVATEPEVVPAPPVVACPRCGTPLRDDQEWCLNCGAATATRVAAPSGWRAPLAIVGAVLAIALAALVVAFLAISDDSDQLTKLAQDAARTTQPAATPAPGTGAPTPPPGASPAPGEAGADPEATVPPATGGEQPPAATPTATPDPEQSQGGTPDSGTGAGSPIGTWPAGEEAYTVVLLSSRSRSGADRRATELAAGGTQVGVLESSDFKSLRGGYFVVFSGRHDSRDAAERAAEGLASKAPGAYVRRVTPR